MSALTEKRIGSNPMKLIVIAPKPQHFFTGSQTYEGECLRLLSF